MVWKTICVLVTSAGPAGRLANPSIHSSPPALSWEPVKAESICVACGGGLKTAELSTNTGLLSDVGTAARYTVVDTSMVSVTIWVLL